MSQPKVIALGLEDVVMDVRRRAGTLDEMVQACAVSLANRKLEPGERKPTITKSSIERYLARLDKASVPEAHTPQAAKANATLAVDVAANMNLLDTKLRGWIEEAETATRTVMVGHGEGAFTEQVIDWPARTAVAKEMRQHGEAVVGMLEKVHNAMQVEAFQTAVMEAIEEADPEVARRVVAKMNARQSIQRAALMGATAP